MTLAYVDSSALVKLVLDERDAAPMRRWYVEADRVVTSHVGAIETRRAVARKVVVSGHVDAVLRSVSIVLLSPAIGLLAASLAPATLRTLDAIHLATALEIGPELDGFVTYDERLAAAAREAGLPVVQPA
jgi:predicted nucleic acid-binding protein